MKKIILSIITIISLFNINSSYADFTKTDATGLCTAICATTGGITGGILGGDIITGIELGTIVGAITCPSIADRIYGGKLIARTLGACHQ